MSTPGNFVPPEPGGFVPPEAGGFVPDFAAAATPAGTPPATGTTGRRKASRHNNDQLGIVWLRGSLHFAALRQRKTLGQWSSPEPVRTVEEFAAALDTALAELKFEGSDTFLVFEGEEFVHQPESVPAFSASATKAYIQTRVAKYTKEHGPVLWVAQPVVAAKDERAVLLHLLPQTFYSELLKVLRPRQLDLTRILPMVVPVQREMNGFPISRGAAALVAVEAADATILIVAQAHGSLLFARTILASLEDAPGRVAGEINRSLLYAKQQFNVSVDHIWLATRTGRALADVESRCGAGKMVVVLPTRPEEWVQTAHRVARTQPINLVAGYIQQKRRNRFIRFGLIAAGWLCLLALGLHVWETHVRWREEHLRLEALQARTPELTAERDRLQLRNRKVERERALRQQGDATALPPVPARLLAHLAALLPADARLTEFAVKWNEEAAAWTFQCDGLIAGDDESAREALNALQRHLARGPLRIRFPETPAGSGRAALGGASTRTTQQRFTLEGTLFEN